MPSALIAVLIDPSVPVRSKAAINDVAIFIFSPPFLCVMTTASAMFIPAEALCGNSLIQHELYLSGNEQEILVKSRSVSRYHRMAEYQHHGSKSD